MPKEKNEVIANEEELFKRLDKFLRKLEDSCNRTVEKAFKAGYGFARQEAKDCFRDTEKRLYDYPVLKENVEKYKLDIEDLKKEKYTDRAKDIVRMSLGAGGTRLSREEKQATKIMNVEAKVERDSAEIDEIDYALNSIQDDEYYMVIEYKYFDRLKDTDIAENMACDESTVRRHKNRLVHRLAVKLHGAAAR